VSAHPVRRIEVLRIYLVAPHHLPSTLSPTAPTSVVVGHSRTQLADIDDRRHNSLPVFLVLPNQVEVLSLPSVVLIGLRPLQHRAVTVNQLQHQFFVLVVYLSTPDPFVALMFVDESLRFLESVRLADGVSDHL
jgi:hypothetical protein